MIEKTNLLFLLPGPIYRPNLPNFKDKYLMLSKNFKGLIITWATRREFYNYRIGDFTFYPLLRKNAGYLTKFVLATFMFWQALNWHRNRERFKVIVCYDPLYTGIIGVVLKYLLRVKLVIEINGDLLTAGFLERVSMVKRLKRIVYKVLVKFSLTNADAVKLVNKGQSSFLERLSKKKHIFIFNDFVPTHYFMDNNPVEEKYILFMGFPFYLKGVDVLIRAFQSITDKYPDFTLKLIGHKLESDAKRYFENLNGKIKFYKPVFYDQIKEEFRRCYCFVLPSRTEGMPRVLLEAISSAKPVIGANVGGIPEIIEDGKNGFIFQNEDVKDLAEKLDILLGNPQLAKRMGERGSDLIKEKFSSKKYCEYFTDMVKRVSGEAKYEN